MVVEARRRGALTCLVPARGDRLGGRPGQPLSRKRGERVQLSLRGVVGLRADAGAPCGRQKQKTRFMPVTPLICRAGPKTQISGGWLQ